MEITLPKSSGIQEWAEREVGNHEVKIVVRVHKGHAAIPVPGVRLKKCRTFFVPAAKVECIGETVLRPLQRKQVCRPLLECLQQRLDGVPGDRIANAGHGLLQSRFVRAH
jgi:hypothetical protein